MTSSSHFNVAALAIAIMLTACGGREASAPIGPADAGSWVAGDASIPGTTGDSGGLDFGDDGGGRNFGDDGSPTTPTPPVFIQNGNAPEGLTAGPLVPGTCPVSAPAAGDGCAVDGARCSYGDIDTPTIACRDWAACTGGIWTYEPKAPPGSCDRFTPVCLTDAAQNFIKCKDGCHFDDGTFCECSFGSVYCAKPTADPNCPPVPPNQGVACASNARCIYGLTGSWCGDSSSYAECIGNVWITIPGPGCRD